MLRKSSISIAVVINVTMFFVALVSSVAAQSNPGGTIVGACTGVSGDHEVPVPGYFVTARRVYNKSWLDAKEKTVVTRCRLEGQYNLTHLPPGTYTVTLLDLQNRWLRSSSDNDVKVGVATQVDFRRVSREAAVPRGMEWITSQNAVTAQAIGMNPGEYPIQEVVEFRGHGIVGLQDGRSFGLPSKDVPGMSQFGHCMIVTNDDSLNPSLFLTGPDNVAVWRASGRLDLLLPAGNYQVQAFLDVPTNLAEYRGADVVIKDVWTIQPGSDNFFEFAKVQANGLIGELPRSNIPLSAPPIAAKMAPDSVMQELEHIRSGPHQAMPAAQASSSDFGHTTELTIANGTAYTLFLYLSGPVSQKLEIAPGQLQTLALPPGLYEIGARISDPSVTPFYGRQTFGTNIQYSEHFYITEQSIR